MRNIFCNNDSVSLINGLGVLNSLYYVLNTAPSSPEKVDVIKNKSRLEAMTSYSFVSGELIRRLLLMLIK